jgi:hypothetical protein
MKPIDTDQLSMIECNLWNAQAKRSKTDTATLLAFEKTCGSTNGQHPLNLLKNKIPAWRRYSVRLRRQYTT